jgi:hypothetical protein
MKPAAFALIALLVLPLLAQGQSTLSFPRAMAPGDYKTTGFAIVNPGATNASVTFTLYGSDGTSQGTSTQTIPARGQLAKLGSDFFPGSQVSGWVQATSPASGLQGFWLGGDFATFTDGAEAAPSSSELVVPLMAPQSEIDIANTSSGDIVVVMHLLGADGGDLGVAPKPQLIKAKGVFRGDDVLQLFYPIPDFSIATHMRIECKCSNANPFAATLVGRGLFPGPEWVVVNGVPASTSSNSVNFPHIVDGPQGTSANWRSLVGVTNLSTTSSNDVTISFLSAQTGLPLVPPQQRTLPPNGGIRASARDLLALPPGFQDGWIQVTSNSGLPLTGSVVYAELNAGGAAAVLPQTIAQTDLMFAHIADLVPFATGLALLNTNAVTANIQLWSLRQDGSLIGTAKFSLAPGNKVAGLLKDWTPQTQTRTSDGGFVFVRSDQPLFGIELFFSRDVARILANVSASRITPGTYVPPAQ